MLEIYRILVVFCTIEHNAQQVPVTADNFAGIHIPDALKKTHPRQNYKKTVLRKECESLALAVYPSLPGWSCRKESLPPRRTRTWPWRHPPRR